MERETSRANAPFEGIFCTDVGFRPASPELRVVFPAERKKKRLNYPLVFVISLKSETIIPEMSL